MKPLYNTYTSMQELYLKQSQIAVSSLNIKIYDIVREAKEKAKSIGGPHHIPCIFCKATFTEAEMQQYTEQYSDLFNCGFHCSDPEHVTKAHEICKNLWNCCPIPLDIYFDEKTLKGFNPPQVI